MKLGFAFVVPKDFTKLFIYRILLAFKWNSVLLENEIFNLVYSSENKKHPDNVKNHDTVAKVRQFWF